MSNHDKVEDETTRTTCDGGIPSKYQVWKLACRPHTLTASIVPVLVGCGLTLRMMHDHPDAFDDRAIAESSHNPSLLSISSQFGLFACLIQISTNLHNDYADCARGADTKDRVGQARATQRGWLTPHETCRGCASCLFVALCVGARLCLVPTNDIAAAVNAAIGNDDDCENGRGHCDAHDGSPSTIWGYNRCDPLMTFVVLSSMFNAVAYTGGPFPLGYVGLGDLSIGYSGLGDVFVFLYFGIVATMGVPYLYLIRSFPAAAAAAVAASSSSACLQSSSNALATTTTTTMEGGGDGVVLLWNMLRPSLLHSLPVGFLATAIIVVNNLRDRHTDVHAGKRTLAVRCGETFARMEYLVLVLGSYAFCIIYYCYSWRSSSTTKITTNGAMTAMAWTALLPLLSLPAAMPQLRAVAFGGKDGMALNDHVGGTARLQMMYCVLMAIGLAISSR